MDFTSHVRLTRAALTAGVITLAAVHGSTAFGQSQDIRPLYDRIERLQRDVDVLQRQLARPGAPAPASAGAPLAGAPAGGVPSDYIGRTEDRFSNLEQQIRELTGRLEQAGHQVGEVASRLDKLISDIDFRLSALEKGAPASPDTAAAQPATPPSQPGAQVLPGQQRLVLVPGGPPGSAAAPPAVQLPQGSPEAQYEFAYGLLLQAQRQQSDFSRPEQALRAFIAAHPSHRLAGNAQYWLGRTYYVRRDYQNAVAAFAEGLQKYPRNDKAAENMLNLGMSLGQLNRKAEACGTLGELDKRFPSAAAEIKQAGQRERSRLGCS